MRDVARRFNARFGDGRGGAGRARAPHPRGRRADHGPAGPHAQDVHDQRLASRAPCTCSTSPRRSRRSSRAPSPTPAARCAATREKPGVSNLIEILAAVRGADPAAIEAELAAGALRRTQGSRRRGRRSTTSRRCASATAAARRRARARGDPRRPAPRARRRSPPPRSPTCASAWASDAPVCATVSAETREHVIDGRYGARMSILTSSPGAVTR